MPPITIHVGLQAGRCAGGIECIAQTILNTINGVLVPLLFAIAFIVFLYGVAKTYIFSHGDSEAVGKGHTLILWGLIGFVVMVSIWGMVNVVSATFGLGGRNAPQTPTSISPYSSGGGFYVGQGQQNVQYTECPKDAKGNCI